MRGSLAVWWDARNAYDPNVQLHFNLWKDLPRKAPDVLDVGFLIQNPSAIQQLYFYIPGRVSIEDVRDLSKVLNDNKTLSAVFNELLSVGRWSAIDFEAMTDG